jgi:hypothetical protein
MEAQLICQVSRGDGQASLLSATTCNAGCRCRAAKKHGRDYLDSFPAAEIKTRLPSLATPRTHNPPLAPRAAALLHQSNALTIEPIATTTNPQLLGESIRHDCS